jgi:hypothetical protein
LGATESALTGVDAVSIDVLMEALAVAAPPPETLAVFTCGETAFAATLTVTVIGG